jgi:VIT1/CCC1 family predicted Fe2+/Mn2+ transporter
MEMQKDFWKKRLNEWTVLDKPARASEVLFGLIMVLTITGTIRVSTAGKQEMEDLLWAALGCNLAWGIVDAIMYLMDTLIGRARNITQLNKIRKSGSGDAARELVRENIAPLLSDLMEDDEIDRLGKKLKELPEPKMKNSLIMKDFLIAGQIFLLVFISTFPVALPFLLFKDITVALRASEGAGLIFLFAAGFILARYSGLRPFITALVYTTIGAILVVLTMALGG